MEVSPPTDLQYDRSVQEWCFMDSPDASVADLLSAVLLDNPSVNPPWDQSFTSLLLRDQQRPTVLQPPADPDISARTNLGVNLESTQKSTQKPKSDDDLWSSEDEKTNFLASLGLASICGGATSSETCSTISSLWPESPEPLQEAFLMEKLGGISRVSSSSSIDNMANNSTDLGLGLGLGLQEGEDITVVDSWSIVEEQMLRAAMADNIFLMQPAIQWQRIAEALPWRTPSEVFNRAKQLLQSVFSDLSTVMFLNTEQKQQERVGDMSAEQKHLQQQQIQRRYRWSKEEHKQFLVGVERYGWGNWKMVATLIPGRTVPQVTSHAQKCLRDNNPNSPIPKMSKRRRRNWLES